jgi:hypothetical protein
MEGEFAPARHAWLFNGSNVVAYTVLTDYPSDRKELYKKTIPRLFWEKATLRHMQLTSECHF